MSRDNNEIFNQPPPGVHPAMPKRDVMRDDFGWEVPVETVPLPSKGVIYPQGSSFCGRETVDIRAMTAREEDILTSRAYLKRGTVVNELIKSCMVEKGADPQDLIAGDRNALMVAMRITGYGSEYRVEATCPKCGKAGKQTFDLGNLGIKRLQIEPVRPRDNAFSFTLPVTKKQVVFKFLTGHDQQEITTQTERMRSIMPDAPEPGVTLFLERSIVSVGEITDKTKIGMFVKNMPAQDSRTLRNYIRESEPNIDMSNDMTCPTCGEASRVDMPIGSSFLWPDT
jgi:hypothetical protein